MKYLQNKIWKINKQGAPNKKGVGEGGSTENQKINKRRGTIISNLRVRYTMCRTKNNKIIIIVTVKF